MTHPARTDYVLTLADGRAIIIAIEPQGNASWDAEMPRGQVDPARYSASRESFGEALRAMCRHAERWSGSRVIRCEPRERVDEVSRLRARVATLEQALHKSELECARAERVAEGRTREVEFLTERADELRARVAELETIVQEFAKCEPVDVYGHCVCCLSRNHTEDCVWLQARKAMAVG